MLLEIHFGAEQEKRRLRIHENLTATDIDHVVHRLRLGDQIDGVNSMPAQPPFLTPMRMSSAGLAALARIAHASAVGDGDDLESGTGHGLYIGRFG